MSLSLSATYIFDTNDSTQHIILDESDRLFSPDFRPQVLPILAAASNPAVEKCFLSATMPAGAEAIAKAHLRDGGVRVVVGIKDSAVSTVDQSLLYTGSEQGKILALRDLVSTGKLPYPSLIFVQSVERAEDLYKTMLMDGLRVDVVHGNRSKLQRDAAVAGFRTGDVWILVVTEVLARGMDFRGVKVVVNYGECTAKTAYGFVLTARLPTIGPILHPPNRPHGSCRTTRQSHHLLLQRGCAPSSHDRQRAPCLWLCRARIHAGVEETEQEPQAIPSKGACQAQGRRWRWSGYCQGAGEEEASHDCCQQATEDRVGCTRVYISMICIDIIPVLPTLPLYEPIQDPICLENGHVRGDPRK